jgi:hypothetical protein
MGNKPDAYIHRPPMGDSTIVVIDMEEAAVRAISSVIRAHGADFDAALAPLGLSHEDMLMPEWKRPLRKADLEKLIWMGGD